MNTQLIPHTINDRTICQRKDDGYIHATAMCNAAGKRLNNYLRNTVTRDFIDALATETRIRATELVVVKRGGTPSEQGTWVHPKVALHLAQWLSPGFAVQVVNWVFDWMNDRTGQNPITAHRPRRRPRWNPTRDDIRAINSRASQILQTRFSAVRDALLAQIRQDRADGHHRPLSDYNIEPTTLIAANDPGLPRLQDGQALFMIDGNPVLIDFTDASPARDHDVIAIAVADDTGPTRFTIEGAPPAPSWFDRCFLAKPDNPRNPVRPVVVVIGTVINGDCNENTAMDSRSGRHGRPDDCGV
ncbi:KilA-N domain-containing protein [Thalassospira sp. SM2505]